MPLSGNKEQKNTGHGLTWVFDPVPPSGALQGGNAALHVFDANLESFVREVLQNSRDQRRPDEQVEVRFILEQLDGQHKEEFLQTIVWGVLREHLHAAEHSRGASSARILSDSVETLEREPLVLMRIEDSGTYGLTGKEDDRGDNFNALCRHTLMTTENAPQRGGFYGLGKAVLWRFSSIYTVLFSSRVKENPRDGFRLFGRAELPNHETDRGSWNGPGWFGVPERTAAGRFRAVSAWDEVAEEAARQARLFRGVQLGTGTSILIVGFQNPAREEPQALTETAEEIARLAARWFWPSIHDGSLEVKAQVKNNGTAQTEVRAELAGEVDPFVRAMEEKEPGREAVDRGQVAEARIPMSIPSRKDSMDRAGSTAGNPSVRLRLRVATGIEQPSQSEHDNRIALVRGSGMVVKYFRPRSQIEDRVFHGVLLAGEALGDCDENLAVERFLQAAEPPAHNDWLHSTDRLKGEYKRGYRKALEELWKSIDGKVAEMCQQNVEPGTQGPEKLRKMFRLKGPEGAAGSGTSFVPEVKAELHGTVWHFWGKVRKVRNQEKPWQVAIRLRLAAETGKGENLPLEGLEISRGKGKIARNPGTGTILVAGTERLVEFSGHSVDITGVVDAHLFVRTRLDVDINSSFRGAK